MIGTAISVPRTRPKQTAAGGLMLRRRVQFLRIFRVWPQNGPLFQGAATVIRIFSGNGRKFSAAVGNRSDFRGERKRSVPFKSSHRQFSGCTPRTAFSRAADRLFQQRQSICALSKAVPFVCIFVCRCSGVIRPWRRFRFLGMKLYVRLLRRGEKMVHFIVCYAFAQQKSSIVTGTCSHDNGAF